MIDTKKIEQLARQIQESMPKGIRDLGGDVEKKIRQVLQSQFSRMDLISREEFDVQTQVLLRTREKLSQLELRINALETMPQPGGPVAGASAPVTSAPAVDTTAPVVPVPNAPVAEDPATQAKDAAAAVANAATDAPAGGVKKQP